MTLLHHNDVTMISPDIINKRRSLFIPFVNWYMSSITDVDKLLRGLPLNPPFSNLWELLRSLGRDTVVLDMIRPSAPPYV